MVDKPVSDNYPTLNTYNFLKPWSFTHVAIILSFGMLNIGSDQVKEDYVISKVKVFVMCAIHETSTSIIQLTLCYPDAGLIESWGILNIQRQYCQQTFNQPTPENHDTLNNTGYTSHKLGKTHKCNP